MSGHSLPPRDHYRLRNQPQRKFLLQSSVQQNPREGCLVKVLIVSPEGQRFRYEVIVAGDYWSSKAHFTSEMFLEVALSLVRSQLESQQHCDTRLTLLANSGLPRSQVGISFEWDQP